MRRLWTYVRAGALALCVFAQPLQAETVVAARTLRAQTILSASDLALIAEDMPGMFVAIEELVGFEARVALYAGRPIRPEDIGPAAIIDRNQMVTLVYRSGNLTMVSEGRSLARAGVGDTLRAMNLTSKTIVSGQVTEQGSVIVGGLDPSLF
ncbi:flagellar basal body P-ring biosynthesis protein FlgA [Aquimixticola soesokkakensis]|uniref:Flagella basal body P-ring formation protein FlgA n=1 Tax=Aquimixticola soesokkakensis TaxID=1519096 RepID=A0A1Y5RBH1_9RHOB|nr:flagellar basal body P-ring formation chaperone FlgA [Aquimixticola soesokkakensis]SLN12402.1 flagellar basal body P-ring biosynthesis protein FlgA [Aquimixticola soesokkakensis]